MKPNFALSLSFDGIKLLHRVAGGWREVGDVAITSDDLAGELAMLRKTATSLEPGGVRSKLIIPSSQIKYLTIATLGLSEAACRKEAERALEGATPYEVAELALDISVDGPQTHVAAVARETLAEAEAFATEHRFHPVSFVAVPEDTPFVGEPYFGPTNSAAALLDPSETVEPDDVAVMVVGTVLPEEVTPPESEAAETQPESPDVPAPFLPNEAPEAPPEQSAAEQPADEAKTAPKAEAIPPEMPAKQADSETIEQAPVPDAPTAEPLNAEDNGKSADKPASPKPEATPAPEEKQSKADTQIADPDLQPELDLSPAETTPDTPVASQPSVAKSGEKEAPPAAPAPATVAPLTTDAPAETVTSTKETDTPVQENVPPVVAAPVEPVQPMPEAEAPASPPREAPEAPRPESDLSAAPKLTTTGFATRRATPDRRAKPLGGAQRVAAATPQLSGVAATTALQPDSSSLTQAPPAAEPVAAAPAAKAGFFSRRKPRKGAAAPLPAATTAIPVAGTESERMTVFGERTSEVRGKPRFLGLIMTVILLVFLAGVAAWAAVFLDDGIAGLMKKDTTHTTASALENQISPEIIRIPDGIAQTSEVGDAGVELAALDPVLSAESTAVVAALQNPRPEPQRPVITEAEAAARYAVTGIWPLAPQTPLTDPTDDPSPAYLNSIDARTGATDAIALPAPRAFETDRLIAAVASPPPYGQRAGLDAVDLIKPTAQGVIAPGGYTLIAASPPQKPPANVLRGVQVDPEPTEVAVAFPSIRPKNRPLGLAERSERASLGGVSRVELAAFRPSLRPKSIQDRLLAAEAAKREEERKAAEAAVAARTAAATQAATAAAAAALSVPQATQAAVAAPTLQNATRLATARSVRPDTRPRNFARIVKRAQRAAPKETRVAAAASVAPRTVTPSVPSQASVTRSATVKNAINLRKVNLIGVYGKPASRRALIRLSNGRYQKVKVGDRIDGGRVAAIDSSELRYVKSGRNVVLKMP